jgi:hypothetical protein
VTPAQPPKIALWLLCVLSSGPHAESLAGDLQEQFAGGRSSAWYWRQVGAAIARSGLRFARVHGFSFAAAFTAAWIVMALSFSINELVWNSTHVFAVSHGALIKQMSNLTWLKAVFIASTVVRFGVFVFAGWLAARIHPAHRVQAVTLLLFTAMFWRFVPQRIAPVYDDWTHVFLHMASAIGGLLIGALVLGRRRSPPPDTAT